MLPLNFLFHHKQNQLIQKLFLNQINYKKIKNEY